MNPTELIQFILHFASDNNYPDIHINSGNPLRIRNKLGDIEIISTIDNKQLPIFQEDNIKSIILVIAWNDGLEKFLEEKELDTSYSYEGWERYRVNCYIDSAGFSIAMRLIPTKIPTLEELWLGDQIKNLCGLPKGLILVTGPTGSWKSTNLAAMINHINTNYKKHIITIEDPVEFSFSSDKSLVNQRQVGSHTHSFSHAIRSALREDPDVIMVWEMRDPETIKAAITLAETGHLVLSTLHTNDSVQTIDRMVDVFPTDQQKQIRMQLAMSLAWVVSQRLVPKADGVGRIPAREILLSNDAVRNLIIGGKTHQLYSVLEVWQNSGMILMDKYLLALYKKEIITKDTLLSFARNKDEIEMLLK